MGDYKRDSEQDNSRDCPIWGTDDISDEELLKEFEAVKNMTVPLPIPSPSSDEFEKIWATIQEERAESKNVPESNQPEHPKVIRPRFGWKRLAAIGLIACLVAGSGCMVAMGTKSYFYRERDRDENNVVYNNDSNKTFVNGEEEAYALINQHLGIQPLKLGYRPSELVFSEVEIKDGLAYVKFNYGESVAYFIQSKYEKTVSFSHKTDSQYNKIVKNKWIKQEFKIKRELLSDGCFRYETSVVIDGGYYRLSAEMEEDEFIEIVKRLVF